MGLIGPQRDRGGEKRAGYVEVKGNGNRGRDRTFEKERERGDRDGAGEAK